MNQPFGGKTVVFLGEFRQILPVIPYGSRQDIVNVAINSSSQWDPCKVIRLTKNMRLQGLSDWTECTELKAFSNWISSVGYGKIGGRNDGYAEIEIPDDLLVHDSRATLAPTLEVIDDHMVSLNPSPVKTYLSFDSTCKSDSYSELVIDLHTPEYLNSVRSSGVPNHELRLKVGVLVMLLRNIDPPAGLYSGTRLIVTRFHHIIEARILTGSNKGQEFFIPRMALTPSDIRLPFTFQRRQLPLMVSYAMTINKSQRQSLSHTGIFLKKPVFSH